jgi:hypothetical protein
MSLSILDVYYLWSIGQGRQDIMPQFARVLIFLQYVKIVMNFNDGNDHEKGVVMDNGGILWIVFLCTYTPFLGLRTILELGIGTVHPTYFDY